MKRDERYFKAFRDRDRRYDGKFFIGVKTTGIYCRPICPAKPKRENMEFFKTRTEAEAAGYRACLRCRPETAPQSAAWIGKSAVVRRAVKLIDALENGNEVSFAEKFGVTARHLRRLFIEETGKTPRQLFNERRLSLAYKNIVETQSPITEVAMNAGFKSLRRFNDAFKNHYHKTPSQIRQRRSP